MSKHCLYRFFDQEGGLLYVGISMNPSARWAQHRQGKDWWAEVANISIETHQDRKSVLRAELQAIRTEHPRYNVVGNGRPPATRTSLEDSTCPACGLLAAYSGELDRYFHLDGSNNRSCWAALTSDRPEQISDTQENGIDRLFRLWPHITRLKYPDDPDLFEANATQEAAKHFYDELETGDFRIGYPDNEFHVALAYIVEAARHMCGIDYAGALRLLRAAIGEIEAHP